MDLHPSGLPFGRERPRWDEHDAHACLGDFFGEEVRLCCSCNGHLDRGPVRLLHLTFEMQQGGDDVRALHLDDKRCLALLK